LVGDWWGMTPGLQTLSPERKSKLLPLLAAV
jgi:hypothetical protein